MYLFLHFTEWDAKQEDQTDVNVWEDNWDDDAIEDDFSIQLRSELENQGMKMESWKYVHKEKIQSENNDKNKVFNTKRYILHLESATANLRLG